MIPQHITDLIEELKSKRKRFQPFTIKGKGNAYGELLGILWATKEELEFLSSEQMNHLVKEADIGSSHDEYMPLEIHKRKLKEIIKAIEGVLK